MSDTRIAWLRFLPAATLLAAAILFMHAHSKAERLQDREELASLPLAVGEWTGTDLGIQPEVREVLGEGDFLSRIYARTPGEPPVDLFIAYFPTQRTGSTMHSPQNCLPGAGWTPVDHTLVRLTWPSRRAITVNRYVIAKGLDRQLAIYWYQSHGRAIASEYWAKLYLVADSIRTNRSDGALVRIITPLARGEIIDAGEGRAADFARQLTPLLDEYVPQ